MPLLRSSYCGMRRYFSNSAAQAASVRGGIAPVTGFHSVIDSPDPVNRVAPPTATIATTSAASTKTQTRTVRAASGGVAGARVRDAWAAVAMWERLETGSGTALGLASLRHI